MLKLQLEFLIRHHFRFISLEQAVHLISRRRALLGRRYATLTFDDGYADFLDHVMPLLTKYDIPCALFIVTDRLGGTDDWSQFTFKRRLLTRDELRVIRSLGNVCLGSHAAHHVDLTNLDQRTLELELSASLRVLADLGQHFFALSYPWGKYTIREKRAAVAAGYHCAVSTDPYYRTSTADTYNLGRLTVKNVLPPYCFGQVFGFTSFLQRLRASKVAYLPYRLVRFLSSARSSR